MRLALVGCGAAAEFFHVPTIRRVLGDDPIWLVDPDRRRARSLARRRDHVATSHGEVLPAIDAALVAVPNDLHAAVANDLLRAGVHVLCEKPLARTAAEASTLAEAAAAGGATLAVGHFRRFFDSTRKAAQAIAEQSLGVARSFHAQEGSVFAWSTQSMYLLDRERSGGGVLLDVGTHVLDQLRVVLGELDVVAYRDDAHGGVEADCVVELAAGGVEGTVELSRTRDLGSTLVVECERGTLTIPLASDAQADDGGYLDALEAQLRDFLDAATSGRAAATGVADALAVATAIDRCYAVRSPLAEPWVLETVAR